ncbi:MAG: glycogen debranching protein [Muriicola sp.]
MMMRKIFLWLVLGVILLQCKDAETFSFAELVIDTPHIEGKKAYLKSPFVTAGNRVYLVGHQDGSFPELGWHIKNEMGGLWDHPIKLMDGFQIMLGSDGLKTTLNKADKFTNYPFANKHTFELDEQGLKAERWQFVPDDQEGILIQLVITNKTDSHRELAVSFTGYADLRPTWLGERSNMLNSPDISYFNESTDSWVVRDSLNPWFVTFGANIPSENNGRAKSIYHEKDSAASLSYSVSLAAKESRTIQFAIAGSYVSENAALATYKTLQTESLSLFKEKRDRYAQLANQSKLTIPDKHLQQTFEWLKYNCDWLVRTVPEIGTGITAGIPDYPWWFGVDSEYALKGYMAVGQTEAVNKTISLLDSLSEVTNGNGRIVHEVSTNGAVFNEGNINETPQFASLIWEIYKWNGDRAFLERYFPTIKNGLGWLMREKDANGNGFPDGFGMMEIHGLDSEMIDVAVYTQRAFSDAAEIAGELGDTALANQYQKTADAIKDKINTEFWSDEFNSYADFIGTDQQALRLIEDAMIRADTLNKPWAVAELEVTKKSILAYPSQNPRPFVLHHNWVVNTPMEMKLADPDKALRALTTAETFVNPFGVFVTGIDRDASAGSDEGSFKGSKVFSYTGAVMTLPTGVQAIAENNYGRPNQALNYLQRMARTFSFALPGSMYEVSPDYGMMTQAWNIYSFAIPIVQQFFGVEPMASQKKVKITPQMPDAWPNASLENILIADNSVSVFYKTAENGEITITVTQKNPEWEILLRLPEVKAGDPCRVMRSSEAPVVKDGYFNFKAKGNKLEVSFRNDGG